ncbi:MAG: PmoA family protein [Verrucomicrobiota bacterium]
MKPNSACPFAALLITLATVANASFAAESNTSQSTEARFLDRQRYLWFQVPIEVSGISPQAEFIPIRQAIDFGAILKTLQVRGLVDERTLRIKEARGKRDEEFPVQYSPARQPRLQGRRFLEGTSTNASFISEFEATNPPPELQQKGEVCWIVRKSSEAAEADNAKSEHKRQFRLEFGVPRSGRAVQVPFEPFNVRFFDEEGRATPNRDFGRMQIHPQWPVDGEIRLWQARQLITAYHVGPFLNSSAPAARAASHLRRPFFFPVHSPDGISLTEFGKPNDPTGSHAHHYSLWIAHANVDGHDFWSERGGSILHEQLELQEDGPVFCRFIQRTRWRFGESDLLQERRQVTAYVATENFRLLDIELELMPAGAKTVTLGRTSFGLLAVRVAQSMTVFDGGGEILNAKGDRNEQTAHLQRAAWLDQSGPVAARQWAGIAMLDHPSNLNHPTGWHCRNDGWAGAAFNMETPHTLEPQTTLKLRYRLVLHRQDAVKARIGQRFAEFSAEPSIQVGAAYRPDRGAE